jgi:hypothetical protein
LIQAHIDNISEKFIPQQGSLENEQPDADVNEIVQTICGTHIVEGKNFILRSEKLPHVKGEKATFHHLFGEVISMIINHPPPKSKLFLYITCKETIPDAEVIDMQLANDVKLFQIDFHTNITSDEHWTDLYKAKLAECSVLLRQHGSSFSFFPICNTGCLFSISLPGKIN